MLSSYTSKFEAKREDWKTYKNVARQIFCYNDYVKLTASVKPTNKLTMSKFIFLLLYPK